MKTMTKLFFGLAIAASIPVLAHAGSHEHDKVSPAKAGDSAAAGQSDGEIKKVDKEAGKITVKHGQLVKLDMPPMTMVFRVKDMAMLDQVKAGDKVKFSAEKFNGALTITSMQAAK